MKDLSNSKLLEIFEKFEYHPEIFNEIQSVVLKKGNGQEFYAIFVKNIRMLEELGIDVVNTPNFELLKGTKGLYSMKFKGKH